MAGWIKLYRQIQDCWVWTDDEKFSKGQAWIDIILSCNHADKKIAFNGKPTIIQRGQWLTSILNLSNRWGWSRHKVSDFLNTLVDDSMLILEKDNKRTLITVVNYSIFQACEENEGQQKDNKRTSEGHQKDTNNNDKECINNENNNMGEKSKRFIPPTIEEVKAYCQERNNSVDANRFVDFYASKNWFVGKNKMKDWKAAVRTWEHNNDNDKKGEVTVDDRRRERVKELEDEISQINFDDKRTARDLMRDLQRNGN